MADLTISAKDLGRLADPKLCRRCAWLKIKLGSNMPYQSFPGIFSSIDSYTKRLIDLDFQATGQLPVCMSDMIPDCGHLDILPALHWSKFKRLDPVSGMTLRGTPDLVLRYSLASFDNTSMLYTDYKTAKYTEAQSELEAVYRVQLNSYGWIGNAIEGYGGAERLVLAYFEPVTDVTLGIGSRVSDLIGVNLGEASTPSGFHLRLKPRFKDVPIDEAEVLRLLMFARELHDTDVAPSGVPGCKECTNVAALVEASTSDLPRISVDVSMPPVQSMVPMHKVEL